MITAAVLALAAAVNPIQTPARWTAVNAVLAVADYETAHAYQHPVTWNAGHTRYTYCYESNALYGSRLPSRAAFYSRGLAVDLAVESAGWLLSRKLERHRKLRRLWAAPFVFVTYSHAAGIASNLSCP